jgi:hypothetical protein
VNPLPQRRGAPTSNTPPSTQYRPAERQRTENSYRGTATFTSPASTGFAEKLWAIALPSGLGVSNAQCRALAQTWGSLRQGRQFAIAWAADINQAWLEEFTPVRRVDFSVPIEAVGWVRTAYLVEALNLAIDPRSAAIGGRGVDIGQVSVTAFDEPPPLVQPPGEGPEPGVPMPDPPYTVAIDLAGLALGYDGLVALGYDGEELETY